MSTPRELMSRYATQSQMSSFMIDKMTIYTVLSYAGTSVINDGVTDAYSAMNTIKTAIGTDKRMAFFPSGTYLVNTSITFPSTMRIWLSKGAILKPANGVTISGYFWIEDDSDTEYFDTSLGGAVTNNLTTFADVIANIPTPVSFYKTDGNTWTQALQVAIDSNDNNGVYIDQDISVDKVTVKANGYTKIISNGKKITLNASSTNHNCILFGYSSYNSTGVYLEGVVFDGNGANQTGSFYVYYDGIIKLQKVDNVVIKGCIVYGCANHQCNILANGQNILIDNNVLYSGNVACRFTCGIILGHTEIGSSGVDSRGVIDATICNNYIYDIGLGTSVVNSGYGIYALSSNNVAILNNVVTNCNWVGILSQSEFTLPGCTNILITGNIVTQDSSNLKPTSGGMFGPFCIYSEVSERVNVDNNICVMGATGTGTNGALICVGSPAADLVNVHDNILDITSTTNQLIRCGILLASLGTGEVKINNNVMELNQYTDAFTVYIDQACSNIDINNNKGKNVKNFFTAYNTASFVLSDSAITFNKFNTIAGSCIVPCIVDNLKCKGNEFKSFTNYGVLFALAVSNSEFSENKFITGIVGFVMAAGTNINNTKFDDNIMRSMSGYGFMIQQGSIQNTTINGNKIELCGGEGIRFYTDLEGNSDIKNIQISRNVLINNTSYGIYIDPTVDDNYEQISVTENICYDNRTVKTQTYGIGISATTYFVYSVIANNVCLDVMHSTAGFHNVSTSAGKLLSQNNISSV